MHTYEYECRKCGENLEVFQSFDERPLKKHKGCGGELKKVFHARGVVFKGSGFYKTDSRKSASTDNGKTTEAAGKKEKAGSTSEKKSDSSSGSGTTTD